MFDMIPVQEKNSNDAISMCDLVPIAMDDFPDQVCNHLCYLSIHIFNAAAASKKKMLGHHLSGIPIVCTLEA
jgi:hypothetical protein